MPGPIGHISCPSHFRVVCGPAPVTGRPGATPRVRAARGRADLNCPAGLSGPGVRVSEDGSAARSVTPSASKSGSGQRRHWHEPSRRSRLVVVVARARGGLCPSGACGRWGRLRTPPQCTAAGLAPLAGFRGPGAGGLHNRVKWLGSRGRGIVDGDRHRIGRGDRQRGRLVLPVARRRRSWWHLNWWHLHRVWKGTTVGCVYGAGG